MSKPLDPNIHVKALEQALEQGQHKAVRDAHDKLRKQVRGRGPAPDWDRFPAARDFFAQN